MKKVLYLENLDCVNCAAALEREIAKIEGISSVNVAFVAKKLTIEYETEEALQSAIDFTNHFEKVHILSSDKISQQEEKQDMQKNDCSYLRRWLAIGLSTLLFLLGVLCALPKANLFFKILKYVCFTGAYLVVGFPVLLQTSKHLAKGKIFDENFLMTVASIGAMCIGEFAEGVLVMLLYQVGELLQTIAVGSSRRSISRLMELKSDHAILLLDGEQKIVTPQEIKVGDVLLVKTGERVPVDGILLDETAVLDEKSLTGEAEYKTYKTGEQLLSGCINVGGMYAMKAVRCYSDSAVKRILDLVENAASQKAEPEKFITKFAKYYTPIVCALAVIMALFVPIFSGLIIDGRFYFKDYTQWIERALTFLVISCPCALIISVPLTYFSGIGACAKHGILVKGATYLDVLATVRSIAFDKTGTLTQGNFTICAVHPEEGVSEEELLTIAATMERASSHPIARAFDNCGVSLPIERAQEYPGRGVVAVIDGEKTVVGNETLMRSNGIQFTQMKGAYSFVYVAKGGRYLGVVEVGDLARKEAKSVLEELKKLGFTRLAMLTGDGGERAWKIANEVGMYEVNASLLPDQKLQIAHEMLRNDGLIYVGDGINDAPVMSVASCAVSMGTLGSAAAVEASDMVLVADDLKALPKAVVTARKTRNIVIQNIVGSIACKLIFMVLGVAGYLPLGLAVFADVGVMLLAVLNSFRVKW